jgi:hypothetical protein
LAPRKKNANAQQEAPKAEQKTAQAQLRAKEFAAQIAQLINYFPLPPKEQRQQKLMCKLNSKQKN